MESQAIAAKALLSQESARGAKELREVKEAAHRELGEIKETAEKTVNDYVSKFRGQASRRFNEFGGNRF